MYEIVPYYQVRFRTFFVQKWTTNVYVILSGGILFDRKILFTENPRKIESAVLTKEGYRIKIEAVIDGEQKVLYAGYKAWKCNDLYPSDFTKRYHSVAYAMDAEALYLSVGLINTSYKEEYCLWVNSEDKVIATWRPNVTYLPEEPDMVWKFTGTFE